MSLAVDKHGRLKLSERVIERQLTDALTAHGWRVLRTNKFCSGNAVVVQGAIEPGIPDLLVWRLWVWTSVLVDGPTEDLEFTSMPTWRMIWIEAKRPGEDLNDKQRKWWADHPDEEKRIARCLEDIEDLL